MKTVDIAETDSYYKVICPKCQWVHWYTQIQYDHPKYFKACDCGTDIKLNKPIKQGKPQYQTNDLLASIVDALIAGGYSKKEAIDKASRLTDTTKPFDQLFREAVSL